MAFLVRHLLSSCFISLLIGQATTKQIGCVFDVVFISTDSTLTYINLTAHQCTCQLLFGKYSGFNYHPFNETCQLFCNFTNDFDLLAETQSSFCFLDKPPDRIPRTTAQAAPITTTSVTTVNTASSTVETTCVTSTVASSGCTHFLALRLSTDPCNLISFTQTTNPLNTIGFSTTVTKRVNSFPNTTTDGCTSGGSYVGGNPTGKMVLVRRGSCFFNVKSINTQNAGASVVVIYNNAVGNLTASINGSSLPSIPVVTISAADGVRISTAIDTAPSSLPFLTVVNATFNC